MPAKQTPMFQINILLFVSLISTSKKTQSHIPIEEAYTRKQPPEMFCKKVFLEISQNSQENTSARVSFLVAGSFIEKGPRHGCFPVNFAKVLKTPFLQNASQRLLLLLLTFSIFFSRKYVFSHRFIFCFRIRMRARKI